MKREPGGRGSIEIRVADESKPDRKLKQADPRKSGKSRAVSDDDGVETVVERAWKRMTRRSGRRRCRPCAMPARCGALRQLSPARPRESGDPGSQLGTVFAALVPACAATRREVRELSPARPRESGDPGSRPGTVFAALDSRLRGNERRSESQRPLPARDIADCARRCRWWCRGAPVRIARGSRTRNWSRPAGWSRSSARSGPALVRRC